MSSSSHLSRQETSDAITEITGMDPTSPSLNEVKIQLVFVPLHVHLHPMTTVKSSMKGHTLCNRHSLFPGGRRRKETFNKNKHA